MFGGCAGRLQVGTLGLSTRLLLRLARRWPVVGTGF